MNDDLLQAMFLEEITRKSHELLETFDSPFEFFTEDNLIMTLIMNMVTRMQFISEHCADRPESDSRIRLSCSNVILRALKLPTSAPEPLTPARREAMHYVHRMKTFNE